DAGLLMNPVGGAADRMPSKSGLPAAATDCEANSAAAMVAVPASPKRPPRRVSPNSFLSMPLPLSERFLNLMRAHYSSIREKGKNHVDVRLGLAHLSQGRPHLNEGVAHRGDRRLVPREPAGSEAQDGPDARQHGLLGAGDRTRE